MRLLLLVPLVVVVDVVVMPLVIVGDFVINTPLICEGALNMFIDITGFI